MEIRKATAKDIDRILDLLHQVLDVHVDLRPDLFIPNRTKYTRDELQPMLEDKGSFIYVAVIDGYVVGSAFCKLIESPKRMMPMKTFYLDDLCVDKNYRHQGIGETLFKHIISVAKENGCYDVTLTAWPGNEPAMRFYEKMGFKVKCLSFEKILEN